MKRTLTCLLPAGCALAWLAGDLLAADPVSVQTVKPARGEIHRFVTLPGSVRADQQATIYARVAGYLKSLTVDKGDRVEAGQALGEIEAPELAADHAKFKAEVKVAETEFARIRTAQGKAPDLVTPQSVDEARGRLEIASANLERTQTLMKYANITAPFAGIVTERFVDPGAFIPSATSRSDATAAAIVTLANFDTVRVQVAVPELEAARIRPEQPVRLVVEGLGGKAFDAKVSRLGYALDEATRTMLVEADLSNPGLELRPGMYVSVKVGVETHADALLLPAAAVVTEKAGSSVFTIDQGKARKVPVKIGFSDGALVEVLDGIGENQPVILTGKLALTDGQPVQVAESK